MESVSCIFWNHVKLSSFPCQKKLLKIKVENESWLLFLLLSNVTKCFIVTGVMQYLVTCLQPMELGKVELAPVV